MSERKNEWGPDVEELTRFSRWAASGQTPHLNAALAAVQGELATFAVEDQRTVVVEHKDGTSHSYKYITLGKVIEATAPILAKHGLSFRSMPGYGDQGDGKIGMVLRYTLAHSSGEQIDGTFPISSGDKGIQGMGSAITYARRYCLAAVLNVAVEQDDDGMAAMLSDGNGGIKAQTSGKRGAAPAARSNRATQQPAPSAAAALPGGDPVTGGGDVPPQSMMSAMFATLNDWKGQQSRGDRLALVSRIVGRQVATSKELTRDDVGLILTTATAGIENGSEPTVGGPEGGGGAQADA